MRPDWQLVEKRVLTNSKFVEPWTKVAFPGYIDHPDHPFAYCESLTHKKGEAVSNKWANFDGPELFEKNLKIMPADWRYRTDDITYNVNGSGYRTYEWKDIDWKNAIVVLGCSNTFGVGLDEPETITGVLEELTGRQVVNLGYPAGSNDIILHNASMLFEKFGAPYSVVVNWTTTDRMRYFERHNAIDVGPWSETGGLFNNTPGKLYNIMIADEYNVQTRNYFISRAMNAIWQGRTKYITLSYFNLSAHFMLAETTFKIDNKARDLLHPGYENSKEVAQYVYHRLNEQV